MSSKNSDFKLYTLFDISKTDTLRVYNPGMKSVINNLGQDISLEHHWNHSRNQHRNWQTIVQLLGIRSQVDDLTTSQCFINQDLRDYKFGKRYLGNHNIWSVGFSLNAFREVEQFETALEVLKNDFSHVPLIVGLNETTKFTTNCFVTSGPDQNVYFSI